MAAGRNTPASETPHAIWQEAETQAAPENTEFSEAETHIRM
jgi:hypothetical protein